MAKRDPRLRAFVKVDKYGQVVPGTLILRYNAPEGGRSYFWHEIIPNICCTTTTTTTTTTSSTTTTTTTAP
jgi:hypothetical protein